MIKNIMRGREGLSKMGKMCGSSLTKVKKLFLPKSVVSSHWQKRLAACVVMTELRRSFLH